MSTDRPSRRPLLRPALLGASFVGAVALLVSPGARDSAKDVAEHLPSVEVAAATAAPSGGLDLADTAEDALKAVVNISTVRTESGSPFSEGPFGSDPFFREFFRNWQGDGMPKERREQSRGSGVIVKSDGTVLTNNHVVEKASEIKVTLSDGREYEAELVGSDPRSDLAVLKLKGAKGLQTLPFGNSADLRLGEMVLAIGNPFGLEGTVTMGIVSAKGRANVGIVDYEDFIQTDAAINPGNSGGALVNRQGELVGINTAILSRSGGYQGIGFAIPSDMAQSIMSSLLKDGKVARGWLGVLIQDLKPELAEAFDIDRTEGALIADVVDDSPAAKAGFQRGDVVVEVGGRSVRSSGELRNRIGLNPPGTKLTVEVLRSGKSKKLKVRLGSLPETAEALASGDAEESSALAGVRFGPLDDGNRQRFEITDSVQEGLVVTDVDRSSLAARAGLRPGDVVVEVNRRGVGSIAELNDATRDGERTLLLIVRGGQTVYMVIRG